MQMESGENSRKQQVGLTVAQRRKLSSLQKTLSTARDDLKSLKKQRSVVERKLRLARFESFSVKLAVRMIVCGLIVMLVCAIVYLFLPWSGKVGQQAMSEQSQRAALLEHRGLASAAVDHLDAALRRYPQHAADLQPLVDVRNFINATLIPRLDGARLVECRDNSTL